MIALLAAVAFAIVGLHNSSGRADPTPAATPAGPLLGVTDGATNAVTTYPAASTGDVSPSATITGLSSIQGVALDFNGNTISGTETGLSAPYVHRHPAGDCLADADPDGRRNFHAGADHLSVGD